MSLTILGIGGLLIAPATGTYHYLVLLLPVALFLSDEMKKGNSAIAYSILALHAAIGFVPYAITRQFEGQGVLTLLAYPRLAALTIIYVLVITTIWKIEKNKQET